MYFNTGTGRGRLSIAITPTRIAQLVRVDKAVTLQPGDEVPISVKLTRLPQTSKPTEVEIGMFEPGIQLRRHGLLATYSILNQSKRQSVMVWNTSDRPINVDANTFLGYWTPVKIVSGDIRESTGVHAVETSPKLKLPAYLQDLVDKSELDTRAQKEQLKAVLHEYRDVMTDPSNKLGKTHEVKHTIDTGDVPAIKQAPRRTSSVADKAIRAHIDDLWKDGLIRSSTSPWSSPIVLAKKKDGTLRFCVDYRKLNAVTKKDAYPLPRIDDCLDTLKGAQWFSTLDLRSGYWQIPMADDSIEKTAFCTRYGLFEFLVMPFGLTNAPATFERLMERVMSGLQWTQCLVYIDDIIVFGNSFSQTLKRLASVFDRLRQASLTCKPSKCELFRKSVKFLGHVVSRKGISCDPDKVEAVASWPQPTTVRHVRSFLGLASYYRKFIPHFAAIASPMVELTKAKVPFIWGLEQKKSFEKLKDALCSDKVLAYPVDEGFFILDTDASDYGIGAVLSQVVPDKPKDEKVIAYASKTLSPTEKRYCTTRKELLAVVTFVKQFKHFLTGRKFLLRTDHASLLWLVNFKNPEGILARWLTTLGEYMPFDCMKHRAGKFHDNADALSRRPNDNKKCPSTYHDCPTCYPANEVAVSHSKDGKVTTLDCKAALMSCRVQAVQTRAESRREEPTPPIITGDCRPELTLPTETDLVEKPNFRKWSLGWTKEYLTAQQALCPDLLQVRQWLQTGGIPYKADIAAWSHELRTYHAMRVSLCLIDGIVYRKVQLPYVENPIFQVVLPPRLRRVALKYSHNHLQSGHQGENNTAQILRRRFYWPSYRKDCRSWCRGCLPCQRRRPRYESRAPLEQIGAGNPGDCVSMDIMGPFPLTARRNRYILVITDIFSKWVEAYALPNKSSDSVARVLVNEYIVRYGAPQRIHSDQGGEFQNRMMECICRMLDIHQTRTSAYRPQSDGQTERFNRTLLKMLRTVVESDECNHWDDLIPMLTSAYRATEHKSTGCTPNLLFLGRESRLPLDILADNLPHDPKVYLPNDYAQWLQSAMSKAHHYARQHTSKYAVKSKEYYDRKSSLWKPTKGEWVYRFYPPKAKNTKLSTPWMGPYVVTDVSLTRNATIAEGPESRHIVVHIDQLKRVEGELQSQTNWIKEGLTDSKTTSKPDLEICSPENSDEEPDSRDSVDTVVDHTLDCLLDELLDESVRTASKPRKLRTRFNEKGNQHLRYDPHQPLVVVDCDNEMGNSFDTSEDENTPTPCVSRRRSRRRRKPPERYGLGT